MATSAGGGLEAKAKHYILAAFAAGFIAAAVVTVVFVVLSPAHLSFSITVTNARYQLITGEDMPLILSLAVQNPSRRAAVQYRSIFIDVSNSTDGSQWVNSMRARVWSHLPLYQPRRSEKKVNVTVSIVGPAGELLWTNPQFISVTVTAVARFKVGVAWTKLYDIKVYCGNLDLLGEGSSTADCQAAA